MKYIKKGSASYIVLTVLEKAVDGYVRFEDFTYHSGRYVYGDPSILKKAGLAQAIKRLRDGELVEEVKLGEDIIYKLTQTGREFLNPENKNDKWDGKWRIVVFDIPEQKRAIRNLFRRNLKKWGFKQLQKSVWVSKHNVYGKLLTYVDDLKLDKWVSVIEADKVSGQIIE